MQKVKSESQYTKGKIIDESQYTTILLVARARLLCLPSK